MVYNSSMDRIKETAKYQAHAASVWDTFIEIYPRLVKFDCPKIILCGRLSRSGGLCFYTLNKIKVSLKYYLFFGHGPLMDVIIHELAHQVDYNLNGPDNMKAENGHGINWQNIMIKYGAKPDRYLALIMPKMTLAELMELDK